MLTRDCCRRNTEPSSRDFRAVPRHGLTFGYFGPPPSSSATSGWGTRRKAPAGPSSAGRGGGVYQGKGKGRGRGAGSFLESVGEAPAEEWSEEPEDWAEAPTTLPTDDEALGPPPGLEEVLQSAHLQQHLATAQEWCKREGHSTLEEVLDFLDDFAEALGLKLLEKRRLLTKLQNAQNAAPPVAKAPAAATEASVAEALAELLEAAKLQRCSEAAVAWCQKAKLWSLAQVASQQDAFLAELQLKPIEEKRLRKLLQEHASEEPPAPQGTPAAPGLAAARIEELFKEVKLTQSDETAAWCSQQNIGTLTELLGRLDDLAAHLALKPLETKRLRKALDAAAAQEPPAPAAAPAPVAAAAAAPAAPAAVAAVAAESKEEVNRLREDLEAIQKKLLAASEEAEELRHSKSEVSSLAARLSELQSESGESAAQSAAEAAAEASKLAAAQEHDTRGGGLERRLGLAQAMEWKTSRVPNPKWKASRRTWRSCSPRRV
eukprot:s2878_g3.t1